MPITLEARREFADGAARLSLWLGARLARQGEPLEAALTGRTPLYRLTVLSDDKHHPARPEPGWSDPRWNGVLAELRVLYESHGEAAAFEEECLRLLWPLLEPRLARDVAAWPKPEDRPFGFFSFERDSKANALHLHLLNPFAPQSPFAEPKLRAQELSRLLAAAAAAGPAPLEVHCGSWLNSFKPFLDFFPPAYAASALPPGPPSHHYGWWGQFMDRKGGFHRRNGEHLRTTGTYPFPWVACHCAFEALRTHLKERCA